jgi:hypothetical protein
VSPTNLANLQAIQANWIAELALEAASTLVNGPKPSYSLDGESVQWEQYRDAMQKRIDNLYPLIQRAGGPFIVHSRVRL